MDCRVWQTEWGFRRWDGWTHHYAKTGNTVALPGTATAAPTNGDVNPQQLDHVPFTVTAATGVPLDDLNDLPDLIDVHLESVLHPGTATAQANQQATAQIPQDITGMMGIPPGVGAQPVQPVLPQTTAPTARCMP